MSTVSDHLKKHPSARSSTLAWLEMRDRKLAELRAEIAQAKPETAPVAVPVARNPIAAMVISLMRQAVGIDRQVRERTDA